MTDDFDVELRRRFEQLATAAPVLPSRSLTRVSGVTSARAERLVPSALIVGVAVIVVVGAATSGGSSHRPVATPTASESASPRNTPATASDIDGDYQLTITADKSRYAIDEPINISASLVYRGARPAIEIGHDSEGTIMFGIRELVFGAINAQGASRLMCARTRLERDVPVIASFKKSGGFPGDSPDTQKYMDWMRDPVLRLPAGTWHISARSGGPCMDFGPVFAVSAEIEIVVGAALPDTPDQASTPIDIRTAAVPNTSGVCPAARLEGTLASTVTTGLGVRYPLDQLAGRPLGSPVVVDVIWPFGWKAYRSGDEIELFDDAGAFVARTGDGVAFGGGFAGPANEPSASPALVVEGFVVCGGLVQLSPSP